MSEESKALEEIAKATGKSVDLLHAAGRTAREIFGDALQSVGGIAADWARYYRYRNWLNVLDSTQELIDSRQLAGRSTPIPPEFMLPVLDGASIEGDPVVQRLWAALIVNAIDPDTDVYLRKVFVETLRGLEALDAHLLQLLATPGLDKRFGLATDGTLNAETLSEELGAPEEAVKVSLQTLFRYSCIIDSWENTLESLDTGYGGFRVNNPKSNFRLSHLGQELMRAISDAGA